MLSTTYSGYPIVDRDTPPDLDGDEVIDWDMTGKPITRRMVNDWARARTAAKGEQA